MPRMKGADLITEYLIENNIPYVFGICGHGNVGLLNSLYGARDRIKLISPRHEQVAAHMADAYFRVRHQPVATLTSCGPGSCNIVMPLALALSDSSALFAITANVPTSQFNRSPFQEINRHYQADFPNIIRPVVKRSFQPTRVDMLPLALRQAMTTMLSGRPGPVNVDIPFNVFQEEDDVEVPPAAPPLNAQRSGASPDEVAAALEMILGGRAPGDLRRPWRDAVGSLARAHRLCPSAADPGDLVAQRHGLPRHGGCAVARLHRPQRRLSGERGRPPRRSRACDRRPLRRPLGVLLDPGLFVEFPALQAHPCRSRSRRARRATIRPISASSPMRARSCASSWPSSIAARRARARSTAWHADIRKWQAEWEAFTRPNFDIHASPIRPERVVADCQAVLPADAILACDVGVSHNWYMQFWKARRPQTMLNSWGFSGMGFGAAGVLGAKLAAPERPCVAVTGDGCFTMVPHVLCTAAEYDIPVVWVIWNNFAWASIRDIQIGMFGGRELGTAFYQGANKTPYNPDFAAWARASGVEALTVTKSEDFQGALEHAVKSNKPFLLDVHVDAEVRPPATGTWQLPPTPYKEPAFGKRWTPTDAVPAK